MNKLNSFISKRIELFFKQTKKQKKCERVWDIYFWPACKVAKLKQGDVTLSISLFMFHLISVSPHFIDHVSFWFPSIHIPSHSFHVPQSISFIFTLFDCIHITWPFKLIISFTFQPIPSLEINNLLVPSDKYLIIDRYYLKLTCGGFTTPRLFILNKKYNSDCTGKQESKVSYNTDYIFLVWLTSLAMIEKRSKRRRKIEIFIIVKNLVLTKNWSVVSNF